MIQINKNTHRSKATSRPKRGHLVLESYAALAMTNGHFCYNRGMKKTLFLLILLGLVNTALAQSNEVDDFIGNGSSGVYIDLEEETSAQFNTVDQLTEREKKLEEALYIPPKFDKAREVVDIPPYKAQLLEGSILTSLDGKKQVRVSRNVLVRAKELAPGSKKVFILDTEGKKRYTTSTHNALNINAVVEIEPKINPLTVYTDKPTYGSSDKEAHFSHFFSIHLESISTPYYATIFRGERQSANATTFQLKNYMMTKDFPIQVGFNLSSQIGFWEDPVLGTVTWNALFFGPSLMRTFWQKDESRWNFHLSVFKSLLHQSEKDPDTHKFSTLGIQGEIEKEFDTDLGPITLGLNYRFSKSSLKESTEYLENEAIKGDVTAFGAYISYRFNWTL
jgi:hypothetical protein